MNKIVSVAVMASVFCATCVKSMQPSPSEKTDVLRTAETLARGVEFNAYKSGFLDDGFNENFETLVKTINKIPQDLKHKGAVPIAKYKVTIAEAMLSHIMDLLIVRGKNQHDIVAKANFVCHLVGGVSQRERERLFNKYIIPLLDACGEQYIGLPKNERNRMIVQCWIDTCLLLQAKYDGLSKEIWTGLYQKGIVNKRDVSNDF
jgi:hypothetical protein